MLVCPLCKTALFSVPSGLVCQNRHQFDRAREGYVNLLPVQQKKTLEPGDSPAMVQARRAFLESGYYFALADKVAKTFAEVLPAGALNILDIGCGEGYYSHYLYQQLIATSHQVTLFGIDISKAAIKAAAKKYPQLQCAVASSYQLPFASDSVDGLLRIYAPSLASELQRVCKTGGWLCTVTPAPAHLIEIKRLVYQEPRLHSAEIAEERGFTHQSRQHLSWMFKAKDAEAIQQLLQMIPLGYRISPDIHTKLLQERPAITLDFYIDLYQRC